jgi:peptide/nickel transport system substrate-binding protein
MTSYLSLSSAALALMLSASVGASAQEITMRSVPIGNLQVLDPIWSTAYSTRNHAYLVWDTLFAMDANNAIQPQMVDTWKTSDDGLTWTFTLREGLLWHDGSPVKAEDCVASIKRWGARDGMGRSLLKHTKDLQVVDDRTFTLVLNERIGFVLDALGKIDSNVPFMMPKRLAETDPNEQIKEVIGSGPFEFVKDEWVPGSKVVYRKFKGYVPRSEPASMAAGGKVVHIDRLESVYMPDAGVAVAALSNGEVDLHEEPAPDLLKLLENNPDVTLVPNDPLGFQTYLIINHMHPPFNNKLARQALQWGTKQSDFMATIVGDSNRWQECGAVFGCGTANASDVGSEALTGYDLDKAKALLKESGYSGEEVVLLDPTDSSIHPAVLVAAQSLRNIGFNVKVDAMDWSTLTQRRTSKNAPSDGGWSLFITNGTVAGIGNPVSNIYLGNCEQSWYGWPCDEEIVKLNSAWLSETDAAKKSELIGSIQARHIDNVSNVLLGQYRGAIAHGKNIEGVISSPSLFYWNIKKTSN